MESNELAIAGKRIIFGLNLGYGAFLTMLSLYGVIFVFGVGPVLGFILGIALMLIAWIFLREGKKEGWLYAFIINIVLILISVFLIPFPIWVFPTTFSILVIIFMIVPPFREPFQ